MAQRHAFALGNHLFEAADVLGRHGMRPPQQPEPACGGHAGRKDQHRYARAFARHAACGRAGAGEDGNRLDLHRICYGHAGMCQRICSGPVRGRVEKTHAGEVGLVAFHLPRNAVHNGDRFFRPVPRRSFGRKHDRVGTIVNRIGYVGYLGAGGGRAFDHAFQHLRGDDHRLARSSCLVDDLLLQRRNFLRLQFHAQVPAGDHDPVRHLDDFI